MTPILICKYMNWSWQELQATPAHVVDDIVLLMRTEAEAQGGSSKEDRRDSAYAARVGARG